jgi:hypothetical protein
VLFQIRFAVAGLANVVNLEDNGNNLIHLTLILITMMTSKT